MHGLYEAAPKASILKFIVKSDGKEVGGREKSMFDEKLCHSYNNVQHWKFTTSNIGNHNKRHVPRSIG